MTIVLKDGRTMIGTPLQIVQEMKSLSLFGEKMTVRQYVEQTVVQAFNFEGITLHGLRGETDIELADALVTSLIDAGLAQLVSVQDFARAPV